MKTSILKQALDSAATTTASQPWDLALNSIVGASEPLQKTLEQLATSGEQLVQPLGLVYCAVGVLVSLYAAPYFKAYRALLQRRQ